MIFGYRLTLCTEGKQLVISADRKSNLLTVIHAAGFKQLTAPCRGMGTCGKCKIRVTGKVRSVGSGEILCLEDGEILACRYLPAGNCTIYI